MLWFSMKYRGVKRLMATHITSFITLRFVRSAIFVAIIILAAIALASALPQCSPAPLETTSTYTFNPIEEQWVKTVKTISLPSNPDGSQPKGSHTVIIRLDEDNPVKTIWIEEALVIGDNLSSPLLEIDGDPSSSSTSSIRICTLLLQIVDAEELKIHDTEVVRLTMENVVADGNELDIDVEIVNVIGCGRGGASTLFIGVSREGLLGKIGNILSFEELELNTDIPTNDTGLRVDRIRILGPDSGTGFIENLIIRRSSVFGRIEIEDVEIKDLFIIDVTLDNLD